MIMQSEPNMCERISWNVPFYTCKRMRVGLNVVRSEPLAVDVAFVNGTTLPDAVGLLENRGRKLIKSLIVRSLGAPDEDIIRTCIQEALLLNDNRSVE